MFYDERIIRERGKIFKKAAILAAAIAGAFFACRLAIYHYADAPFFLRNSLTEIFVFLAAAFIVLYGEIRYRAKEIDERILADKNQYYSRMGKYLLYALLFGFSLSLVFVGQRHACDFPPNAVIFMFEILGLIFFAYQFKKRGICLNDAFIENDNPAYYKRVFANIGIMSLAVLCMYVFSGMLCFLLFRASDSFVSFLIAGIVSVLGLGLGYLFFSFLEKLDAAREGGGVKRSFIILAVLSVLLIAGEEILTVVYYHTVLRQGLGAVGAGGGIARNLLAQRYLGYQAVALAGVAAASLLPRFRDKKLITGSIKWGLTAACAHELAGAIIEGFTAIGNRQSVLFAQNILSAVFAAIGLTLFFVFTAGLIKESGYGKAVLVLPVVSLIAVLVCCLFYTQNLLVAFAAVSAGRILVSVSLSFLFCRKREVETP